MNVERKKALGSQVLEMARSGDVFGAKATLLADSSKEGVGLPPVVLNVMIMSCPDDFSCFRDVVEEVLDLENCSGLQRD